MAVYAERVIADGAIGYWRFGESAGTNANDETTNNRDGTYTGGYTLSQTGFVSDGNTAVAFNGSTGYVTMGDVVAFRFTSTFSMEFPFKTSSADGQPRVIAGKSIWITTGEGYTLFITSGVVRCYCTTAGPVVFDVTASGTYNDGVAHWATFTWDGTTGANKVRLYIDGVLRGQATASGTTPTTPAVPFRVGGNSDGPTANYMFNGTMDEGALYASELSAAQVAQHYAMRTIGTKELSLTIGGVEYATHRLVDANRVIAESLNIVEGVDGRLSTCTFSTSAFTPTAGQSVIVTLGETRRFAGPILSATSAYFQRPTAVIASANPSDFTVQLNRRKIIKKYVGLSATAIAQDIITTYCAGFTSVNVAAALATINEITFTNEDVTDALTRLAKRIGGYWYLDYAKDLHFFLSETGSNPTDVTAANASAIGLADFQVTRDISQIGTRIYFEGGGSSALAECAVGDTILPVSDSDWYASTGGVVVSGPQRITYTGVQAGGAGSLVGSGASPSAPPVLALAAGAGVETGLHGYAVTFVTGAGESIAGPTASASVGSLTAPGAPSISVFGGSGLHAYAGYKIAYVTAYGESLGTASSSFSATFGDPGVHVDISSIPVSGDARVTARKIYRAKGDAVSAWFYLATIPDNTTTTYTDSAVDAVLGAAAPAAWTAGNQVALSSIPIGASAVTARKVYRTVAAGAQLKLLTTIADNTTTTYTDSTADASLGANVPTSDASGLTQPDGQALSGGTSIVVAGTGAFSASGGWAVIGNGAQVIRYTGITSSSLTGVPASGPGAITATVAYGSTITAAPALIGIPSSSTGSILYTIPKDDPVNLLVQQDDPAAQTALAALDGGDGIQEVYLQDNRLSLLESTARATSYLTLRKDPEVSVRYTCRDPLTRTGRTIHVNMSAPTSLTGDFKIQQVTLSGFDAQNRLYPTFSVQASSTRYSLEDLLRMVRPEAA